MSEVILQILSSLCPTNKTYCPFNIFVLKAIDCFGGKDMKV